jgi:cobalt-zinc-cadmium efflux system outer membrane protein
MKLSISRRVRRWTVAAGLLVIAGWSSLAAQQPTQPVPVPPPAGAVSYQAALDLATARNLGLAAAMRQRAIREAAVRVARQYPNPEFSFEASRDVPHEVVSLGFPVEIGGKRARRIEVAQEELSLADLDVRGEQRTLRRNLRQAFYGLLASDERVRNAEAVLGIAQRVRDTANARFTEGAAPKLEVMEGDLGVARAQADLNLARSDRIAVQADLNAVLNQAAGQAMVVAGDLTQPPAVASLDEVLKIAADSNVDMLRSQREVAIEQRRTSQLRAERMPTPTFSVGGVFNAPGEFSAGLSGAVTMAVPLFARNQGEIAQSTAVVSQLQATREAVKRTVENQVFGAWARLQAQRQQAEVYRDQIVPTATTIEALAEEGYRLGRNPLLSVLEAQRNLRDVRREYLQALGEFQTAIADLEEILGAPIK